MSIKLKELLNNKAINGWNLFWLIVVPTSIAVIITMSGKNLSSAEAVSSMIQFSVRCAVPWLYLAFAASSCQTLFPGMLSRWLLRNRKILGLCFAAAMGWQLFFILWMVTLHTGYYVDDVYVLSDVIEGIGGYLFLIAMVLTSFKFGRSRLSAKSWKQLHRCGIYFLWAYAWSVYWYELFYYEETPTFIGYVYYWTGFLAWGLRMGAWTKKHWLKTADKSSVGLMSAGIVAIFIGLMGSALATPWSSASFELLYSHKVLEVIGTYVPYYPFVPFFPAFIIMLGAFLMVKSRS
jgi:hypothetical protein